MEGRAAGLSGAADEKSPTEAGQVWDNRHAGETRSLMVTSERFTKGLDEIRILLDGDRHQSRSASRGCPSCSGMATLSDEHLRALRFLAQHRGGPIQPGPTSVQPLRHCALDKRPCDPDHRTID
jgi:hypothetical protein